MSGEISGFKRHSSGHLYFSLKDPDAQISCVMFRSAAASLKLEPKDGMQVVVHGSVSIYPRDGKYQLYVDGIKSAGVGELYARYLMLKEKLEAEGLFGNNRPLPALPKTIGVATSRTGAALHDIVTVIRRRFPSMNILFAPCSVQGAEAPREIIAAVNALQRFPECSVIIVGRGGGSYEDLNCFNDEGVARAIASSKVPIVSAVGHEIDFTIADHAADLRAPTPSAAAELCCPVFDELRKDLAIFSETITRSASDRLYDAAHELDRLMGSSAMANPHHAVSLYRERLLSGKRLLEKSAAAALISARERLCARKSSLEAVNPMGVLGRGYAIVLNDKGSCVRNVSELEKGQAVAIRMAGGSASAVVEEITKG